LRREKRKTLELQTANKRLVERVGEIKDQWDNLLKKLRVEKLPDRDPRSPE
jgi:hypothetical protein